MTLLEPILVPGPCQATVKYFNKFWKFHKFLKIDVPTKMPLKSFFDSNTP